MARLQLNINDRLEKKFRNIIEKNYNGNMSEAVRNMIARETVSASSSKNRYGKKAKSLSVYRFYGLWKNRVDMKNSAAWVSKQRAGWAKRLSG